MSEQETFPPPMPDERTSERLRRLVASFSGERVRVAYLLVQLRRRSFGGLLILLAVLALLPGISLFAGIALIVPALQMSFGMRAPVLPRILRRREIASAQLRALVETAAPWLERLERYVRPRWPAMTQPPLANLTGAMIVLLALVLLLPLPLSNFPPALAIICLALGMLERDGLMVAVGLVVSALALVVGTIIALATFEAAILLVEKHFG